MRPAPLSESLRAVGSARLPVPSFTRRRAAAASQPAGSVLTATEVLVGGRITLQWLSQAKSDTDERFLSRRISS